MKKIVIIDDETDLLTTLQEYLQLAGFLVYTAENPVKGRALLSRQPDLILLDVAMPEVDGVTFCREIRQLVTCPIIFLSARTDEASRIAGLAAGGDDYLLKPFSLKELSMRITAHLRREERPRSSGQLAYFGEVLLRYDEKELWVAQQLVALTKTEFLIVELLSLHPEQVYSREQIYERLWGHDKLGDAAIITEHIRRIRSKLRQRTQQEMIQTVWGLGYKWIG